MATKLSKNVGGFKFKAATVAPRGATPPPDARLSGTKRHSRDAADDIPHVVNFIPGPSGGTSASAGPAHALATALSVVREYTDVIQHRESGQPTYFSSAAGSVYDTFVCEADNVLTGCATHRNPKNIANSKRLAVLKQQMIR